MDITPKKRKKRRKKKLTPFEMDQRQQRNDVRRVFDQAGFTRVPGICDKPIDFKGRPGDFDDVFIYKNIVVLGEYTCSQTSSISDHLLKKKILFDHVLGDVEGFLEYLDGKFETFKNTRGDFYGYSEYKLVIAYCSRHDISKAHKAQVPGIVYFDYPHLRYFISVTSAVKLSSKFELIHFLGVSDSDLRGLESGPKNVEGSLLPEIFSNFPKGHKVVTFYIEAAALLQRSYVLRKDGWRDDYGLYQRMIIQKKIRAIRRHLKDERRVFINNIIVTLPSDTRLLDDRKNTVDPARISKTTPVKIQLPEGFNTVGLIDGQHRVFAYHEGGEFDEVVEKLRVKQNLLVTGIIYPHGVSDHAKAEFEAQLFLEINANQAKANSDLKQAIGLVLEPFSAESIAKAIVYKLNTSGPLENLFEMHFYEKNKIKSTSIVSYGLRPLVKCSGVDSLFSVWNNREKTELAEKKNMGLLRDYINFSTAEINIFLVAVRRALDGAQWAVSKESSVGLLSTSTVNGLVICLRRIVEERGVQDEGYYLKKLTGLGSFNFKMYKSSQYSSMGNDLYDRYFR